jgi:hypothetical protein
MIAIAEYSGEGAIRGSKLVRILSCPDKTLIGREWLIHVIPESEGDLFLIKFNPQDQFCSILPLHYYMDQGEK